MNRVRVGRSSSIGLVSAATLLFARPAVAAEGAFDGPFTWERGDGAEACPSGEELRVLVGELVGRDPFSENTGFSFEGEVHREGEELVANLTTRSVMDPVVRSRALRSEAGDCASLGRAVALAIALAVEHSRKQEPEIPAKPAPPAPEAPPASEQPGLEARPRLESSTGPGRVALVAHARWALGTLPRPTAGLGVAARARVGARFSAALGGEWLPSASARGRFSMSLVAARLGACYDLLPGSGARVSSCGYAAAGVLDVKPEAAAVSRAGNQRWFAAGLAAFASTPLGSSWIGEAGLEGAFPFRRPVYQANGCPPLGFQQPVATLSVFVGAGSSFF